MCKIASILVVTAVLANIALALPGSGTEADPWRIRSLADFNEFAADPNYWDDHTRLETNLNLAGVTYTTAVIAPDTNGAESGFQGTSFTGVFDGNDSKLTGLTIDDDCAGNDYIGLFGYIDGGEIRNLGIEDCWIWGGSYVGALLGWSSSGIVSQCYSTGDITGPWKAGGLVGAGSTTILSCHSACNILGAVDVGGLAGSNGYGGRVDPLIPCGPITNCYSTGIVSGVENVGGLVGNNWGGSVSNCYSLGDVDGDDEVGGLVGTNIGNIVNCNSIGYVSGHNSIGGLVGSNSGYISKCRSAGDVNGRDSVTSSAVVGGLVGQNSGGTISNCSSCGSVSGTEDVGGLVGNNSVGTISDCNSRGNVSGTENVGGLVGHNDWRGIVSNGYSTGDVSGYVQVGGLVGLNDSGIVSNCYATGKTSGSSFVGGLAGINKGGNISNSYSTGQVNGEDFVGGLVGHNYGIVSLCYSASDVDASGVDVGGLVGSNIWTGIILIEGRVSNCFWDIEVQTHGVTKSIGDDAGIIIDVAGADTAQMQTKSTFISTGWDFDNVWNLDCEGMNYPRLIWQVPIGDLACPHGIDYSDYTFFANRWMATNCADVNDCEGADFDFSGTVNGADLQILLNHWLDGAGL